MGRLDQASFAGDTLDDFYACEVMALAEDYARIHDDLQTSEDDWFEDDLVSLIAHRPSRHQRRPAR